MTWGNIDDQVANPAFGDGLQMLTDGAHMDTADEGRGRLQNGPGLHDELIQAAARLLGPEQAQFDFGLAPAGFPIVGFRRR